MQTCAKEEFLWTSPKCEERTKVKPRSNFLDLLYIFSHLLNIPGLDFPTHFPPDTLSRFLCSFSAKFDPHRPTSLCAQPPTTTARLMVPRACFAMFQEGNWREVQCISSWSIKLHSRKYWIPSCQKKLEFGIQSFGHSNQKKITYPVSFKTVHPVLQICWFKCPWVQ